METRTRLEKLFDDCPWERKFHHKYPQGEIRHAWHLYVPSEVEEAEAKLPRLKEETRRKCRGLFLANDSLGQVLIVTEESWEN